MQFLIENVLCRIRFWQREFYTQSHCVNLTALALPAQEDMMLTPAGNA